jgi:hypothetical protein
MNKQLEEQNGKPKDNGRREFIKTGVVLASYVFFGRFLEGCGSPSAAEKIIETLSERQQEILQSIVSSLNRIPENPRASDQARAAFENHGMTMERLIETLSSDSNDGIRIETVPKISELRARLKAIEGAFEKKIQVLSGKIPPFPADSTSASDYEALRQKYGDLQTDEKTKERNRLIRIREAFKMTLLTLAGVENDFLAVSKEEGQSLINKINFP